MSASEHGKTKAWEAYRDNWHFHEEKPPRLSKREFLAGYIAGAENVAEQIAAEIERQDSEAIHGYQQRFFVEAADIARKIGDAATTYHPTALNTAPEGEGQ